MEQKFKDLLFKAKDSVSYVADVASKKGKDVFAVSKGNIKVFDLNTEVDALYREIGKLVYSSHKGAEITEEIIESKIADIDERVAKINEIKELNDNIKNTVVCDNCKMICNKKDGFCSSCGGKI